MTQILELRSDFFKLDVHFYHKLETPYCMIIFGNLLPILTIGIPVYNGEKTIGKRLENILSQSFQDFLIVIYDNSNDSTPDICNEQSKKDHRITHIHDKEKRGIEYAFNFLLQQANTKYFVWAAADDLWNENFLKKNIEILEKNSNVVGSIGQVKKISTEIESFKLNSNDGFFLKYYKIFRMRFRNFGHKSIIANSYEKRSGIFLRMHEELSMYGIFRRLELQKSFVCELKPWKKTILKILKYGNFHVIEEILWSWSNANYVSSNVLSQYEKNSLPLKEVLLPYYEYAIWCYKNIGLKFLIKNLDFFFLSSISNLLIVCYSWIQNKKSH